MAERDIALYPFPSKSIACAGRSTRAVSSSGAPINVDGIIFKKVWVIEAATIREESIIETFPKE